MNHRIKELRKTLKLSQDSFGWQVGLSKSGISNLENGSRSISERHIKLVCNQFNVNENWLRNGIGEMFIVPSDDIEMWESYHSLTLSSKNTIRDFIHFLANQEKQTKGVNQP